MTERISSFKEFWPHYLADHKNAASRRLHFLGTTGFGASVVASTILNPIGFPLAMAGFAAVLRDGFKKEGKEFPKKHLAAMIALPTMASPVLFPAGVVFAYGCAWAGHFGIEKNRPATFKYPLWSFCSDLKMWNEMAKGNLWDGDPLEELGLEDPTAESEEAASMNGMSASPA